MTKILLTGGANGADMLFEEMALKHNYIVRAFSFEGHTTKSRRRIILNNEDLVKAQSFIAAAARKLNKHVPHQQYIHKLISRNYYQVQDSLCVYAVATLNFDTNIVNGGTGWAVEMAKLKNIPLFVFDQNKSNWYEWKSKENVWYPTTTVLPFPAVFTGIGSRELVSSGINAIKYLFESNELLNHN